MTSYLNDNRRYETDRRAAAEIAAVYAANDVHIHGANHRGESHGHSFLRSLLRRG